MRPKEIRKTLKSLPKSLDETYERILLAIDDSYRQEAFTALQWLAFSKRPLSVEELAEAAIIDPQADKHFDPEDRFSDPHDILKVLSGLITLPSNTSARSRIKLAHYSVKEFLVSQRIQWGPVARYTVREIQANASIAETCLAYLLHFDTSDSLMAIKNDDSFPLLQYAVEFWFEHAQVIENNQGKNLPLSDKLFLCESHAFMNWVLCYSLRCNYFPMPWEIVSSFLSQELEEAATHSCHPLYYAALAGLPMSAKFLLDRGANVNASCGKMGNALHAACSRGHEIIVRLLLEEGADVNARGGKYEHALQAACANNHETIVRLLLEKEADVNAQGGYYGNALRAACEGGYETIVRLLLEKEVDVNAQDEDGNALQAACAHGYETIVRLLLEKGVDVNAQGGYHGSALQAACVENHETIVRLLLENGVDLNAQRGYDGNELQAACVEDHETIVRLLLENGANIKDRIWQSLLALENPDEGHSQGDYEEEPFNVEDNDSQGDYEKETFNFEDDDSQGDYEEEPFNFEDDDSQRDYEEEPINVEDDISERGSE
jgi:ankyrin repeat protein